MTTKPVTDGAPGSTPDMRERILDAATHVFLARGYAETSMDRVAKESGAARRTLYNQFKSKEALFEAMVARVWSGFPVLDITQSPAALSDPRTGLIRLGQAIADFWVPDAAVAFLRMVIAEGQRFPALTRTFLDQGKIPAMAAVADYLSALSQRKLVAIHTPQLAARQFLGLIDEPLLWVRVVGMEEQYSERQRRQIVEDAVDMFLGFYTSSLADKAPRPSTSPRRQRRSTPS